MQGIRTTHPGPDLHAPRRHPAPPPAGAPPLAAVLSRARTAPETLRPGDVLLLQRAVGNAAVARMLTRPGRTAAQRADGTRALLRKRELVGEDSEELKQMDADYEASLARGLRLKEKGLAWFKGGRTSESIPTATTEDTISKLGYKDFWFVRDSRITISTHRGEEVEGLEAGEVEGYAYGEFEDDQSYFYSNTFDPVAGTVDAEINYRDNDAEEAKEQGLPPPPSNSEILWHQWNLAHKIALERFENADSGGGAGGRIRSLSRTAISNPQTLNTIKLCDGAGAVLESAESVTLDDPRDPDVWALLGTPNANSAVWLLMQHGADFAGTDIASVTYGKDRITVEYVTA